jgi:hypothetical protein
LPEYRTFVITFYSTQSKEGMEALKEKNQINDGGMLENIFVCLI